MSILKDYKSSKFYKKYKNTYFSDAILVNVFGERITKHRIRLKDYHAVYLKNIEVLGDFIAEYEKNRSIDEYTKWLMLHSIYIDPDNKSIRKAGNVDCSADGLISIRRMYKKYGLSSQLVMDYKIYRKMPIIHFPQEKNGINMSRATVFGDRIDHTLFDIKRYCSGAQDCRLKLSYSLPKTQKWLDFFDYDFSKIVNWLGVDNIFVKNNEIIDLEKQDGSIISDYNMDYNWRWSKAYYYNLQKKIQQYYCHKIYFDMDGVLADFDKGVVDLCGLPAPDVNNPDKDARKIMWQKIKEIPNFYDKLEPMEEGIRLFHELYDIYGDRCEILTGIPKADKGIVSAGDDKRAWCKRFLPEGVKVNVVYKEEKKNFCTGKDCILIDDLKANIDDWESSGGTGVLYIGYEVEKFFTVP